METLGEDLVLLALRPNGTMHAQQKLRFAVAESELLRLAALGRVEIVAGRVFLLDVTTTGHPLLDEALLDLGRRGGGEPAQAWIARARPGLRERYLAHLAAQEAVRVERHRALGLFRVSRWHVLDLGRVGEIRARLDRIAASTGELTPEQAAFAGLVHVAGLDVALYPAGAGAAARARLRQIARKRPVDTIAPSAPTDPANWLVTAVVMASLDAAAPASVSNAASHSDAGASAGHHNNTPQHDTRHYGTGGSQHGGGAHGGGAHGGFDSGGGGGHH